MHSFESIDGNGIYPNEEHLRENRKLFFRGLYFRIKKLNLEEKFIRTIEEVLESFPAFY